MTGRLVIIDYGMGNLRSVEKGFPTENFPIEISNDPKTIRNASGIVLPGVGAFGHAVEELQRRNLWILLQEAIKERQIPLLGICLGMQLLFEESEEYGSYPGLGILRGKVKRFLPGVKIPHLGWNQLEIIRSTPLLSGIPEGCYMYFVHSFYVGPEEDIVCANTDYGMKFASVVQKGNIFATQFHPEKSQKWGLRILKNFSDFVRDSQEK